MMRGTAISLVAALTLGACANGEFDNPFAPLRHFMSIATGGEVAAPPDAARLSRSALAALKEPVGLAQVQATGAVAILVPLGVNPRARGGAVQTWTTQDRQTLSFTGDGRLVATRGLSDDLMSVGRTPDGARLHIGLDSANGRVAQALACRIVPQGSETVTLASGERLTLSRVSEICRTVDGTQVQNEFWRDPQGRARKSRQWVNPGLGYLDWEMLRPG